MTDQTKKRLLMIAVSFLVVCSFFVVSKKVRAEETTTEVTTEVETTTKQEETTAAPVYKKGFVVENGKTYYYLENGKKAVGFLDINKHTYYFDSNGVMQTGLKRINGARYYFKKTGIMHKGFLWRKIKVKKKKKKKIRNYFGKDGKMKTGKFTVGKIKYKARKKTGAIYYVRNKAKAICQRPSLPTGCEITAWTMMVKHAGKKMTKRKAARIMPRSGNPYYGFVGNPHRSTGRGLVIYPHGLKKITKRYLGKYVNMTGCSRKRIKKKLRKGHLVLVWLNGLNGFGSHTVALTGYDKHHFFYNNPWTGKKEKMGFRRFKRMWRASGKKAMSY